MAFYFLDNSSWNLVVSSLLRCCFVMHSLFQHTHLSCTAIITAITRSLNTLQYMTYHWGIYRDQRYRSVRHDPPRPQLMTDGRLFWQCLYQQAYWSKPMVIFKRYVTCYKSFDNPITLKMHNNVWNTNTKITLSQTAQLFSLNIRCCYGCYIISKIPNAWST